MAPNINRNFATSPKEAPAPGLIAPYNGADWQNYRGSPAVNNSSIVTWKTTVKPGKTFEPEVKYHYFARH